MGLALPCDCFITWPTKNPSKLVLAATVFGHLVLVGLEDRVNDGLDRTTVGNLAQPFFFDDVAGCPTGLEHVIEDFFGDPTGNRVVRDEIDERAKIEPP